MILHLDPNTPQNLIDWLTEEQYAKFVPNTNPLVAVTTKAHKEIPSFLESFVHNHWTFSSDLQLGNSEYLPKRTVKIGDLELGGATSFTHLIAGPCSVENEEQIFSIARALKEMGIRSLRAGSYKPRTSPYSFQGLGLEGLKLLDAVRKETGLNIVTEVRDATHVDHVIEYADVVQIGTKSMYDHGILKACGASNKTVLIKRGFGTTLQEFVQAAEFVLCGGNADVLLCERGIRTFEDKTRFTLDLCGVAFIKKETNLPVVVDPSHAMGWRYGVPDLARAAMAMGVDGLLIESHIDPENAWSDAAQQIDLTTLQDLKKSLELVGKAVNRELV